jgi:hypothetical protein
MTTPRPLTIPSKTVQDEQLSIELWREHQPALLASRVRDRRLSELEANFVAELIEGKAHKRRRPTSRWEQPRVRRAIAEAIATLEKRGLKRKAARDVAVEVFGVSKRHVENVMREFSTTNARD